MVFIDSKLTFVRASNNILLLVTEVLLHAAVDNLARSKKLRGWASLNSVLLPPFLAEAVVLGVNTSETALPNTFAANIAERRSKSSAESSDRKDGDADDLGEDGVKSKKEYRKAAAIGDTDTITA